MNDTADKVVDSNMTMAERLLSAGDDYIKILDRLRYSTKALHCIVSTPTKNAQYFMPAMI
jgi:hypothetical protein